MPPASANSVRKALATRAITRRRTAKFAVSTILAVAMPMLVLSSAHAGEGFFTDKRPAAVADAWNSVYAFVCEGTKGSYTASAFPVRRVPKGERTEHYFITAGHAVEDCKGQKRYLVEDTGGKRFEADGITLAPRPQRLDNVKAVRIDDAYDLAVIRVVMPTKRRVGAPLPVNGQCDSAFEQEVYAIGFPGVAKRRSLKQSQQIKRWSHGISVGVGKAEFRDTTSAYIATSVDSLPGNSGGPVLAQDGSLVGVMAKGAAGPQNRFRYDVDPKKKGDWHSFVAPCSAVLQLLQQSGLP
ncbi:S1 family peptidase [Hyphomicrobium sulfonivorans]|uniref:S1 family peptidase n=1 Tax=Hyphomicrobium sulfonivorans TaxID=121290 RepID=UPI00156DDD92|nr:serine protease [Hyphomicrobium sulfonivorans]MBI1649350.1 trypsin-like peptidase domain-containing protein [Hyphomicrobium sulfonivorans]NSL71268.1 hypothetical protein [Hyphomicrobium sulfonivorans]